MKKNVLLSKEVTLEAIVKEIQTCTEASFTTTADGRDFQMSYPKIEASDFPVLELLVDKTKGHSLEKTAQDPYLHIRPVSFGDMFVKIEGTIRSLDPIDSRIVSATFVSKVVSLKEGLSTHKTWKV